MSGTSVVVNPGPPTQLQGAAYANGAVVYNTDPNNAVWLGSQGSISPGNGIRLAPLGTVNWTGGIPWACVDTGVIAAVNLLWSDDVTDYTDPEAVATATALALLEEGVPTKILQQTLYEGLASGLPANGIDVSEWSSLEISMGTNSTVTTFNYSFCGVDSITGLLHTISSDYLGTAGQNPASSFIELTVLAPVFLIENEANPNAFLIIVGTNRVAQHTINANTQSNGSVIYLATPSVTNTIANYDLGNPQAGFGGTGTENYPYICGPCMMSVLISNATVGGASGLNGDISFQDAAGNAVKLAHTSELVADNVAANTWMLYKAVALPQQWSTRFLYQQTSTGFTAATVTIRVSLVRNWI